MGFASRNYDRVAGIYETVAAIYSGGLIRRSKLAELQHIPAGSRVLFLGAGSGEEVIAAAKSGLDATAIDLSEKMTARLQRRIRRAGIDAKAIAGDALALAPGEGLYDAVCGNYFFNVFPRDEVEAVVEHAVTLVKPGGLLLVADMAPQKGIGGLFGTFYLKTGLWFFVLLGLASPHPIYDYRAIGEKLGLQTIAIEDHRWARFLPALYRTVVLRKAG